MKNFNELDKEAIKNIEKWYIEFFKEKINLDKLEEYINKFFFYLDLKSEHDYLNNSKYDIIILKYILHLSPQFNENNRLKIIEKLIKKNLNKSGTIYIQTYAESTRTHLKITDNEINILKYKYNVEYNIDSLEQESGYVDNLLLKVKLK